jgi:hypothetical protein
MQQELLCAYLSAMLAAPPALNGPRDACVCSIIIIIIIIRIHNRSGFGIWRDETLNE